MVDYSLCPAEPDARARGEAQLSYEEVGRLLAMRVGSIGPTRSRYLDRLRRDDGLRALQAASH